MKIIDELFFSHILHFLRQQVCIKLFFSTHNKDYIYPELDQKDSIIKLKPINYSKLYRICLICN